MAWEGRNTRKGVVSGTGRAAGEWRAAGRCVGMFACWSLEAWRIAEGEDAEGEQWGDAHMES